MSKTANQEERDASSTLYLVLQGEFAIYKEGDRIRILAPDLDDHIYLAGPWLAETTIPKDTPLELTKAIPGDPLLTASKNLLMGVGAVDPDPTGARVDISAPWPKKVHAGLREENEEDVVVTVDNKQIQQPPYPAVILVLEYDCQGDPVLSPTRENQDVSGSWRAGGGQYKAIHVYATGEYKETERGASHAQQAFHEAARLLGVEAEITWNVKSGAGRRINIDPPIGLSWYQVNLFLYERLGLTQQLGQTLNGWPAPPVMIIAADNRLGSNNCGPVGDGSI